MGNGSSHDYRAQRNKRVWLRQVANEVLARTNGGEKRRVVLYLVGPQDNDRKLLLEKGVPKSNLIGIDDEKANIFSVRDRSN